MHCHKGISMSTICCNTWATHKGKGPEQTCAGAGHQAEAAVAGCQTRKEAADPTPPLLGSLPDHAALLAPDDTVTLAWLLAEQKHKRHLAAQGTQGQSRRLWLC